MKPALALLVLCALVIRGEAVVCHICRAVTNPYADQSGQPDYDIGDAGCVYNGSSQLTRECGILNGCVLMDFVYDDEGSGLPVRFFLRDCSDSYESFCFSGSNLKAMFGADDSVSLAESVEFGVDYVSANGGACVCTEDECNDGDVGAASPGASAGAGVITLCLLLIAFLSHHNAI